MRIYRKEEGLVTLLQGDMLLPLPPAIAAKMTVTCHCTNASLPMVLRGIFRTFHKSYSITGAITEAAVTLSLDHVSFDKAYQAICKQLPANLVRIQNGSYEFGN